MTTEYTDKMFDTIHSLTLCIEVEIVTTERFFKTELEYSEIKGYTTQIDFLTKFGKVFDRIISKPFYNNVFNPIMNEKDNPDSMDFLFGYAQMKDFFNEFNKASFFLRRDFKDSYTLREINNNIDHAYPGIIHNPELFPHHELITYLKPKK